MGIEYREKANAQIKADFTFTDKKSKDGSTTVPVALKPLQMPLERTRTPKGHYDKGSVGWRFWGWLLEVYWR